MTLRTEWEGRSVEAWRTAWGLPLLEVHQAVPSTMERAWALADRGVGAGGLVLAEEQTAGRGRNGRSWHSPPGQGLWMSWILSSGSPPSPVLPLRIGLRLARGIEAVTPVAVELKWPNDLWIRGRKLGGILTEARGGRVVVGIGLNVRTPPDGFPPELATVATSLEAAAGPVGRGALATALLDELREVTDGTAQGGRLTVEEHEELTRRDLLQGRRVRTATGDGEAAGIRRDGALRIREEGGAIRAVVAGGVEIL